MTERHGTIFEVLKTKAVRHRVPQGETVTMCGRQAVIPARWDKLALWNIDHERSKEDRCKKCYPYQTKRRPWRKKK